MTPFKPTILHLETSLLYRKLIEKISSEIGAIYLSAENGEDASAALKENTVTLIITAMELEGGNSIEFIRSVNTSEFSRIPIIVFTGTDTYETRKSMYELGIVDYFLKSTDPETIKKNILSLLRDDAVIEQMKTLSYAVLDDNKMDKMIVGRIFTMLKIPGVSFFASEKEMTAAGSFDIYIIDLVLEKTTGDKVITGIREKNTDAVIIAVSGIDNTKTVSRILSIGADDYITKPFNFELFISRLRTNIRSYLLLRELSAKNRLLEEMAVTDSLTGLFNRRHFFTRLEEEAEKRRRHGSPVCLVIFDIDHFKRVNDTYGHPFGDTVLLKVAEAIKSSIRNIDIPARYGGEEFALILPETELSEAKVVADRIRVNVERISTGKADLTVTISGGLSEHDGGPAEELFKNADTRLYESKHNGRNRITAK